MWLEVLGSYGVEEAVLRELICKGTGQIRVKDNEILFSGIVDRQSFEICFAVHVVGTIC